jgi:rare lipoprotein A (peptidoglycan hydrolase)
MVKRYNTLSVTPFSRLLLSVPLLVGLALSLMVSGCASSLSRRPTQPLGSAPIPAHPHTQQFGIASWYGPGFHGQPTASGEIYNQNALTAAHPTLPLGTRVEVTNLANGKSVQVRINDRGPFVRGRTIDLSHGAAHKLGMVEPGVSRVRIKPLLARNSGSSHTVADQPRRSFTRRTRPVKRPQPQGTFLGRIF